MDIKMTITVTGKPTFTLTQDNLYEQDLSVGYGASDFSFGLFTAGNFIFTVANENLQYSRDDFAGARIRLEYGSQVMGWYNVDRIKEQDDGYELEIQCYDDILKFDCPFTAGESDFPMSFERALSHCMYLAGLSAVDFNTTSLAVITRSEVAEINIQKSFLDVMDNYTCRDVIRAIAELSCCQATLDTDGRLLLNNPFRGSSFEQILSDRVALEYDRETKPISKVKMTTVPNDGTSETFEYGTDTGHIVDFTLPVFSGSLLRDDILSIVQSAHDQLNGRAVSALSATHEIMGDEIKLYRIGDRYLADDTSGEPLRKRLDGMITYIRYSGNFEFSYSCPGFSQEGNGTSASGNPSGSIVGKILAPVNEEIRRSNAQLTGLISNAKAELSDAIEILDGNFGVVTQQIGEIESDVYGLQVNYADIFAEVYDTEQGIRARLYKAETEIVAQAGLITSKVGQIEYEEFVSHIYGVTESINQDLSLIEQTASNISATVSSHTGQISGLDSRLTSAQTQIDVQSDQISQRVTTSTYNTGMSTKANQTALNTTNNNLSLLTERVNTAELKITDSAIVSTVRSSTLYTNDLNGKTSKNEIISTINQSAESVSISASKINLNGLVTANNNFKINTDGSMETIKAKIGGWTIDASRLISYNSDGTEYTMLNSGAAGSDVAFAAGVNVATGTPAAMIRHDGYARFNNANITGTISSISGNIGGWELASNILKSGTGDNGVVLKSNGTVRLAAGLPRSLIDAGSSAIDNMTGSITTYLTNTGYFKCTNADITGSITATSGKFANFIIQGNVQYAESGGYRTVFKSDGSVAFATGVPTTNAYNVTTGANLQIYHNGTIIANDIRAIGGKIGDWNISNGSLSNSTGATIFSGTSTRGVRIQDGEVAIYQGNNSSYVLGKITGSGSLPSQTAMLSIEANRDMKLKAANSLFLECNSLAINGSSGLTQKVGFKDVNGINKYLNFHLGSFTGVTSS